MYVACPPPHTLSLPFSADPGPSLQQQASARLPASPRVLPIDRSGPADQEPWAERGQAGVRAGLSFPWKITWGWLCPSNDLLKVGAPRLLVQDSRTVPSGSSNHPQCRISCWSSDYQAATACQQTSDQGGHPHPSCPSHGNSISIQSVFPDM